MLLCTLHSSGFYILFRNNHAFHLSVMCVFQNVMQGSYMVIFIGFNVAVNIFLAIQVKYFRVG